MSVNNLFKYDIAVIGLGYVGLPLIITAAKAGMKCLGIDINDKTIKALNNQSSHIERVKNDDLLICKENIMNFSTILIVLVMVLIFKKFRVITETEFVFVVGIFTGLVLALVFYRRKKKKDKEPTP